MNYEMKLLQRTQRRIKMREAKEIGKSLNHFHYFHLLYSSGKYSPAVCYSILLRTANG